MIGCWINDVERPEEIEKAANADLFSLSMRDAIRMCVAAASFREKNSEKDNDAPVIYHYQSRSSKTTSPEPDGQAITLSST